MKRKITTFTARLLVLVSVLLLFPLSFSSPVSAADTTHVWACESTYISTFYRYWNEGNPSKHGCRSNYLNAMDIAGNPGENIYSATDGVVTDKGYQADGFGYYIVVTNGSNGLSYLYGHMKEASDFSIDDSVRKGDIIGYMGSTGLSSGNHLHFEVYNRNDYSEVIDPFFSFYKDKVDVTITIGGNSLKANNPYSTTDSYAKRWVDFLSKECSTQYGDYVYVSKSSGSNRVNLYQTCRVTAKTSLLIRERADINSKAVDSLKSGAIVTVAHHPITDNNGYTWRYLTDGRGFVCEDYLQILDGEYIVRGTYKIQSELGRYVTANGRNIVIYDDLSGTELEDLQIWNFQPLYYYNDLGAIIYRISNIWNKRLLYSLYSDPGNYQNVCLMETSDDKTQEWIVEVRADGSLRIIQNLSRMVLDVEKGDSANNTDLIVYSENGGTNQKFWLVKP